MVMDYVKSLTTQRGSVSQTLEGIADVVALIEQYRGSVERAYAFVNSKISFPKRRSATLY